MLSTDYCNGLNGLEPVPSRSRRIYAIQMFIGDIMAKSKLMNKAPHADLTYMIIGAAMAIHVNLAKDTGRKFIKRVWNRSSNRGELPLRRQNE